MQFAVTALVVAAVAWIAYSTGKTHGAGDYDELQNEVEMLKSREKDAAIVKRVSQQMEDIAYEQMNVSNMQRDRAEEQTRLAEANAARAEEQSRLAQDNAAKAQQQSILAQRNAENARMAAEEAREQRDAATYAKSVSDTLSFRTLSRSLGTVATAKYESKETELADILSYASWYFADKYNGNPYQNETFKALSEATGAVSTYTIPHRSVVHDVVPLPAGRKGCTAVTNYGEVVLVEGGRMKMLFSNKDYDFRAVCADERHVFALSHDGQLCVCDYEKLQSAIPLSQDDWFDILDVGAGELVLVGRRTLTWFDRKSMKTGLTQKLQRPLSTAVLRDNGITLFYQDGSCAVIDKAGKISSRSNMAGSVVTAALYSKAQHVTYLGVTNGDIIVVDAADKVVTKLNAHSSRVTGLSLSGDILVSSSYDKEVYVWNLPKLQLGVDRDKSRQGTESTKTGTPTEWLVPANYSSDAWPLAVCTDGAWAWAGMSDGKIVKMCISVSLMSKQTYGKMRRGLTPDEWIQYVGVGIGYVNLK